MGKEYSAFDGGFSLPILEPNQDLIVAPETGKFILLERDGTSFVIPNRAVEEQHVLGLVRTNTQTLELRMRERGYVVEILEEHNRLVQIKQPLFIVRYFN